MEESPMPFLATVLAAVLSLSPLQAPTLASLATARGIDIGVALAPARLSETAYKTIVDNEFNLVVPENAMKWDATEPTQNQFRWTDGDAVAAYAQSTGKELYGHTLVWHNQLPSWVSALDATALRAAVLNHITTVATHFKGQVSSWDVVNEAFSDSGGLRRSTPFQDKLGDGYIAEAFQAARAADPGAKLCINDYNIENIGAKSTAVYNLVRDFKAQGVPIDCVGFQAHLILGQVPGDLKANLQRFADLGVDVRITELDIRMATPSDAAKLAQQAADYRSVVTACLAVTRCQGVTTWGVTDKYSWIPDVFPGEGAALLWDENYQPKPAYQAVAEALGGVTPAAPCKAAYSVSSQWNTGFTGTVTLTNTGTTAWSGWELAFAYTAGQTITQSWNSVLVQPGPQTKLTNASWNGTVAPGGTVSLGFNASWSGTNPAPTAFTVNATACTTV
ncbi:endo-1,4-beta-xylanase [Winogradskya consettensis]|uniref:Beta-xylanase n=2 Tax=Winogradskya consettensis TaxID=113560 RepID=A0A919VS04_9ACTN|nr:beta-xylanase [Actinoplanes consettensis]